MTSILQLQSIGKSFYDQKAKKEIPILHNINLEVFPHEIVCVVGTSGSGKTSLLNGIGGFSHFTSGHVFFEGKPLGDCNRDRGVVFQDYPLSEFLTALENIALGLDFASMTFLEQLCTFTKTKRRRNLDEATWFLNEVELGEHGHKYPRELSGGQRQRVAIAQALATKPKILLMDEPFSGLDANTRETLQKLLLRVHKDLKNTIFYVTHDLEEAVLLGDRVIVLAPSREKHSSQGSTIVYQETLDQHTSATKDSAEFITTVKRLREFIKKL